MANSKENLEQCEDLITHLPDNWQSDYVNWLRKLVKRQQRGQAFDRSLAKLTDALNKDIKRWQLRQDNKPLANLNTNLPIYDKRDELIELIQSNQVMIIAGETGSGKTTQLPQLCLMAGRGLTGKIGHTQPRRIATRAIAQRLAEELGTEIGEKVGYQIRFDKKVSEESYIKVMTDGVLLNELHDDPLLSQYDTLIIDEAHERSLNIDFILGLLKTILTKRPDLKLIVTSATIDLEKFSQFFNNAPILEVSGRTYPVEVRYRTQDDYPEAETFESQALFAVRELQRQGPGDILIFLPTEQAIRHLSDHLRKHLSGRTDILPLYSRLAQKQQMMIFGEHHRPRIVLATNIAETSLTVPGITYVIDSGLARISRYSTRSKVQRLPIEAISQASANQRKGRCGRTHDGICIRLYSEDDFNSRPEFTEPEILRTNLAMVILQMAQLDLGAIETFDFIEPPEQKQINDGVQLLKELQAMDEQRQISSLGRQLARLPVDPRIGRILISGSKLNALKEVVIIAAAIGLQDPRERPAEFAQKADESHKRFVDKQSDFISLLALWDYFHDLVEETSWSQVRKRCLAEFIHFHRMREWREQVAQLQNILRSMNFSVNSTPANYDAIHQAILSGYLTQVATSDPKGYYIAPRQTKLYVFPGSGLFRKPQKKTTENPVVKVDKPKWIMAAELVETSKNYARLVAQIKPQWIESLAGFLLRRHHSEPFWSKKGARAMVKESGQLYGLTIYSGRNIPLDQLDKAAAREWFIREGLVEIGFKTRSKPLLNNWELLEEVEQLQDRSRRRDLVVDKDWFINFYEQKLPDKIHNGASFDHWIRNCSEAQRNAFQYGLEDICKENIEQNHELFPSQIMVNTIPLEVHYRFEPGKEDDGIHIHIPLITLNQFDADDFQWLVPGLFDDLLIALIRGLPKAKRKRFVPVPEYVRAVKERLEPDNPDLLGQLAKGLQQMSGEPMSADEFRQVELPSNLKPNFVLLNQEDEIIYESKDLSALQIRFKNKVQKTISADHPEKQYDNFPKEGIDVSLTQQHGLTEVTLYQGLKKVNNNYQVVQSDNQAEIQRWHEAAILTLCLKEHQKLIREMADYVQEISKSNLLYGSLKSSPVEQLDVEPKTLYEDILCLACKDTINESAAIYSREAYEELVASMRSTIIPKAIELVSIINQIFDIAGEIRALIDKPSDLKLLAFYSDVKERLNELIFKGFIYHSGVDLLRHYPRYMKALKQRLLSGREKPLQARERLIQWQVFWDKYCEIKQQQRSAELRQQMEEYHVMLFAQQLGTKMKVSEKRLKELFREIS